RLECAPVGRRSHKALIHSRLCHIWPAICLRRNYYDFRRDGTMFPRAVVQLTGSRPMSLRRELMPVCVAWAVGLAAASPASAQSVEEFYRGKTVIYNLAVPDGASWGLYARTFIEHLKKHIPGNPNIILQVMPGGGGVAAGNYMYNVAPKDGTVIGTPLSTAIVFAATDPKEV